MAQAVRESTDGKIGVLEIGAGVGVLTKELLERCEKVVCVELDTRLFPVLDDTLAGYDNFTLVSGDILKIDLAKTIEDNFKDMEVFVCANLPYYITSPVIMRLLEEKLPFKKIIVMVQKEAGDRLCARVGTRESGAVTVAVNYYAKARKLFDVSRGSFMPSPNVDSCVIELDLTKKGDYKVFDEELFFKMVKSAFAQRRKTILNSLSSGMGIDKAKITLAVENAGLSPTARAEALTMEQLVELSNKIFEVK
jgi:16S rRNA (adenine1518-N6/adenine1519-N6)-dimethyltransferase